MDNIRKRGLIAIGFGMAFLVIAVLLYLFVL
jgi:hypothetical protein